MENIKTMTLNQVIEARSSINQELQGDVTPERMTELETIVSDLEAREAQINSDVEKRNAIIKRVAETGVVIAQPGGPMTEQRFDLSSKEYRSAFFKKLAHEQLTDVEERAYTHTTQNYGGALPVETIAEIWSNIEEQHAILGDITVHRTGTILELTVHKSIVKGDAKSVSEAAANDDEQNEFVKVTLTGKDFSKHIEISYALGTMTGGALESYLITEISDRLGVALVKHVVEVITSGLAAGNKVALTDLSVKTLAEAFSKAKGGKLTVYVNNTTMYKELFGLMDANKRPVFQPTLQDGANGAIFGALVKVEDALADGEILIGNAKKVVGNFVQDVMIEEDRDIKKHVKVYSGYARFEAALTNDSAFVLATIGAAA